MNKPSIGIKTKEVKIIHPTQCPKCKSNNIIGGGMVIGRAFINLSTMKVDELGDDFEIYDEENLRYLCFNCNYDWE